MGQNGVVRLGVIGLGNIAKQHIDNISSGLVPDCEVTALCSRTALDLVAPAVSKHFNDYRELIESGLPAEGSYDFEFAADPQRGEQDAGNQCIYDIETAAGESGTPSLSSYKRQKNAASFK